MHNLLLHPTYYLFIIVLLFGCMIVFLFWLPSTYTSNIEFAWNICEKRDGDLENVGKLWVESNEALVKNLSNLKM